MWHSRHIMSPTTWQPTMTMCCNVITVASWCNGVTGYILGISSGWFCRTMSSSSAAFFAAVVRKQTQFKLVPASHGAIHRGRAFTQNGCFHHDKTKQKMRIVSTWSHHSPNWLNLCAFFSFPLETERLRTLNVSVHLDCKAEESSLLSFLNDMRRA